MKLKKKAFSLEKKNALMGYVYVFPFLIGLAAFFIPFLYKTVVFSFHDIEITDNGYSLIWRGIEHYRYALLNDTNFNRMTVESLATLFTRVPIIVLFSMVVATMLNMKFKGKTAARIIFFIPVILSCGSAVSEGGLMDLISQRSEDSIELSFELLKINNILSYMNFSDSLIEIIMSAAQEITNIVFSSGLQIYLFLIGFQEVPGYLYEAAQVEGCSKWEQFWKITVPMVSPQIMISVIYTLVDSYVRQDTKIYTHIYNITFFNSYGTGTAMYIIYLVYLAVIMSIIWLLARKHIVYNN